MTQRKDEKEPAYAVALPQSIKFTDDQHGLLISDQELLKQLNNLNQICLQLKEALKNTSAASNQEVPELYAAVKKAHLNFLWMLNNPTKVEDTYFDEQVLGPLRRSEIIRKAPAFNTPIIPDIGKRLCNINQAMIDINIQMAAKGIQMPADKQANLQKTEKEQLSAAILANDPIRLALLIADPTIDIKMALDTEGNTALDLAISRNCDKAVNVLIQHKEFPALYEEYKAKQKEAEKAAKPKRPDSTEQVMINQALKGYDQMQLAKKHEEKKQVLEAAPQKLSPEQRSQLLKRMKQFTENAYERLYAFLKNSGESGSQNPDYINLKKQLSNIRKMHMDLNADENFEINFSKVIKDLGDAEKLIRAVSVPAASTQRSDAEPGMAALIKQKEMYNEFIADEKVEQPKHPVKKPDISKAAPAVNPAAVAAATPAPAKSEPEKPAASPSAPPKGRKREEVFSKEAVDKFFEEPTKTPPVPVPPPLRPSEMIDTTIKLMTPEGPPKPAAAPKKEEEKKDTKTEPVAPATSAHVASTPAASAPIASKSAAPASAASTPAASTSAASTSAASTSAASTSAASTSAASTPAAPAPAAPAPAAPAPAAPAPAAPAPAASPPTAPAPAASKPAAPAPADPTSATKASTKKPSKPRSHKSKGTSPTATATSTSVKVSPAAPPAAPATAAPTPAAPAVAPAAPAAASSTEIKDITPKNFKYFEKRINNIADYAPIAAGSLEEKRRIAGQIAKCGEIKQKLEEFDASPDGAKYHNDIQKLIAILDKTINVLTAADHSKLINLSAESTTVPNTEAAIQAKVDEYLGQTPSSALPAKGGIKGSSSVPTTKATDLSTEAHIAQHKLGDGYATSVTRMRDTTYVVELSYNSNVDKSVKRSLFSTRPNDDTYTMAVAVIEEWRAKNPNPGDKMAFTGDIPKQNLRAMIAYCKHRGYEYTNTNTKHSDIVVDKSDVEALQKRMKEHRSIVGGNDALLVSAEERDKLLEKTETKKP